MSSWGDIFKGVFVGACFFFVSLVFSEWVVCFFLKFFYRVFGVFFHVWVSLCWVFGCFPRFLRGVFFRVFEFFAFVRAFTEPSGRRSTSDSPVLLGIFTPNRLHSEAGSFARLCSFVRVHSFVLFAHLFVCLLVSFFFFCSFVFVCFLLFFSFFTLFCLFVLFVCLFCFLF